MKFFRFIFKSLKILFKVLGWFFAILMVIVIFNYLSSEWYTFPEPRPFSGKVWYNPYKTMDSLNWRRTNLHMHSRAWGGITNGSGNSSHEIWDTYHKLGYESLGISNYQFIDTLYSQEPYYIPVYEHGYGLFKSHQLSIGAKKVIWYDLPFGQNKHHKQYIINLLKKHTDLLSINHPAFFGGYTPEDFKYLGNYDLIEALNGYRNSIPFWDSALSAGKPAFLMADDDMHDITDPGEVSRRFIMVNTPDNKRENIIKSLSDGNSYGVEMRMPGNETYESKSMRFDSVPVLRSLTLQGDTMKVILDRKVMEIRFFGQNGVLLDKRGGSKEAIYILKPVDTYVRTVVLHSTPHDQEGLSLYLNPVFRTDDGKKPIMTSAVYDSSGTWVYRIAGSFLFIFIAFIIYFLRKRFK
jgi:hypothetical protein